jgi:hypothetical protein
MPTLPPSGLIPVSATDYTITGLLPGHKYLITLASTNWGTASVTAAFNIGEANTFVNATNGTFNSTHREDTFLAPSDTLRLTTNNMSAAIQVRMVLCKDA